MLELGLKFWLAYALGSVMGGLVMGRFRGGIDIREAGSGNLGGTNALRTQGKWFALGVMVIDVAKGILAVALIPELTFPGVGRDPEVDRALVVYGVGFAAILGHVFPIWSGFRGGKGGATAAGLLCYFAPGAAGPILGIWLAIVFLTGFVGIATVSAALGAVVYAAVTTAPQARGFLLFCGLVAALIVYTHRGNIRRMVEGTESRFARYFGLYK
jgi:acyl phosphate:glycerol-3-phosphate acyltransferase